MDVLRLAAFTDDPSGGNPAGVVLDAGGLAAEEMQRIAAEVGFSETAFVDGDRIRYFSLEAEVPFCGHATIAAGVALGDGDHRLQTASGLVPVRVRAGQATLTSVEPHVEEVEGLDELLALLRWREDELDPALPPRVGYAGARHPVLAAATPERLAGLDYDFDGLKRYMLDRDLTTIQLVHRVDEATFEARNPFPVGGVVEDPATGAAAAALGGYLRALGLVEPPADVTVLQGHHMGRPSRLLVAIPESGGIAVTGRAVAL
jgi:PhzF family phenazine biosynthesis protein